MDRERLARFGWALGLLKGDLGISIFTNLPVAHMIKQRLEPTFSLMVLTLTFAISFAVPMGVVAAWQQGIEVAGRRGDKQAAREMTVFARRLQKQLGGE